MDIKKIIKENLPVLLLKFITYIKRTLGVKKNYFYNILGTKKSNDDRKVFCFCCEYEINSFLDCDLINSPIIKKDRFINTFSKTVCPKCASFPRHRICCYYLNECKAKIQGEKVLLFGGEYSIIKGLKNNSFYYKTADLFDRTADYKIDIQNTKFEDNSGDIIICNHILEHVADVYLSLQELRRIVKRDGFILISVPTDYKNNTTLEDIDNTLSVATRIELFGQEDHLRIFGKDFLDILKKSKLDVEIIDGNKFDEKYGMKVGPGDYDDNKVYVCRNKQ